MEGTHCEVHAEKLRQIEVRQDKMEQILERVQNRLPHWATAIFSLLCLAVGWLIARG